MAFDHIKMKEKPVSGNFFSQTRMDAPIKRMQLPLKSAFSSFDNPLFGMSACNHWVAQAKMAVAAHPCPLSIQDERKKSFREFFLTNNLMLPFASTNLFYHKHKDLFLIQLIVAKKCLQFFFIRPIYSQTSYSKINPDCFLKIRYPNPPQNHCQKTE